MLRRPRRVQVEGLEAVGPVERSGELTLTTFNIWFNDHFADERYRAIANLLSESPPDVMVFQEVTPTALAVFEDQEWIRRHYCRAAVVGGDVKEYGMLMFSRLPITRVTYTPLPTRLSRGFLHAEITVDDTQLTVCSIHLDSGKAAVRLRARQLRRIFRALRCAENTVVLGDFNMRDAENGRIRAPYRDVWTTLRPGEDGFTEDTAINHMRYDSKQKHRQVRFDRILLRGPAWEATSVDLLGTEPVTTAGPRVFPSDHFGVRCRLAPATNPTAPQRRPRWLRRLGLTALLAFGMTTAPAHAQPPAFDTLLTRVVADDDLAGAVAVVRDGDTFARYAAGTSDLETGAGFAPGTHIRAGSISKTFVAATILQLVAEGRVDLDAPIERYLPGRVRGTGIDADAITVRQVLRHQSGLPEYFDTDTPVPVDPQNADALLDMALAKPAMFAPGSRMRYTNTNYVVAGLLIESVAGTPAAAEVTRRVITPLGLSGTYYPEPGDTGLRTPFAHGYESVEGRRTDVTDFNASAVGMAGSLISTSENLSAFITALLSGNVVPPAQLAQMMDTVDDPDNGPGFRYGLGLASIGLPCGVTVWGHGGDVEGYHSLVLKPVDGEALSATFTESVPTDDFLDDPRVAVTDQFYCP